MGKKGIENNYSWIDIAALIIASFKRSNYCVAQFSNPILQFN